MNDYMTALHKQFFQEPDSTELKENVERIRLELRDRLEKPERRKLLQLIDAQTLLQERTSLTSFIAGFKLAWGIAKELEAGGLYSFQKDEERQACEIVEREVNPHGKETCQR